MRRLNALFGRTALFFIGCCVVLCSLVLFYTLTEAHEQWVYVYAAILGAGNSMIMITSVCMEGDLVGKDGTGSAFVYGAMSFTDKLSNGLAVVWIQAGKENIIQQHGHHSPENGEYIRQVFCLLPAAAIVLGMVTVSYMHHYQFKNKNTPESSSSSSLYGSIERGKDEKCVGVSLGP